MKLKDIKPYPKNAKKHNQKQIDLVANSIKEFGFRQPIVIDKNKEIIAGHARYQAALKLGLEDVPIVDASDLTPQQVKAYRLADNKLAELAEWDLDLAISELKELDEGMFDLTGFDRDMLITQDEKDDKLPDEVPTVSKKGDLWQLGEHRILCGDSTSKLDIALAMGGVKAQLCFTSPPYNMANKKYYNEYEDNKNSEEYIDFNLQVIKNLKDFIRGFLFWNISYNKNSRKEWIEIFYRIIKETGFNFLESIVWDKGHGMPITQKDALTRQYESIIALDDSEGEKEIDRCFVGNNGTNVIFNKKTQKKLTNYWYIDTFKSQHFLNQACFPVALPTKAIMITTNEHDVVIDPFLGTGSTLIACEKSNRKCIGIDTDPKYIDLVIQRYNDYTGNKATKIN